MRRILAVHGAVVDSEQRTAYLDRVRVWREYYRGAGCRYWIFEELGRPGSFIEFIEAADAGTLEAALAGAPQPVTEAHTYREVELD